VAVLLSLLWGESAVKKLYREYTLWNTIRNRMCSGIGFIDRDVKGAAAEKESYDFREI
jgi:hypothetical protein